MQLSENPGLSQPSESSSQSTFRPHPFRRAPTTPLHRLKKRLRGTRSCFRFPLNVWSCENLTNAQRAAIRLRRKDLARRNAERHMQGRISRKMVEINRRITWLERQVLTELRTIWSEIRPQTHSILANHVNHVPSIPNHPLHSPQHISQTPAPPKRRKLG